MAHHTDAGPFLWLRDAARVYPVTVDPLTTSSLEVNEIEDAHVDNLNFGQNYHDSILLKNNGRGTTSSAAFKSLSPTLKIGDMVTGACLSLVSLQDQKKTHTVEVHRVKQPWSSATLTGTTARYTTSSSEDQLTYTDDKQQYISLDITNLVKSWYIGGGKLWPDGEGCLRTFRLYRVPCFRLRQCI